MTDARNHLDDYVVTRMVRLDECVDALPKIESTLRPDERQRAARFRFPEDKARFALGRGLLNLLLQRYLGYGAADITLSLNPQGRPFLANDSTINFSITHSANLVAVALAKHSLIGIDIEYVPRALKIDELAARIFSDEDLSRFLALPEDQKSPAFFRAWTGKEAHLKAQGIGIFGAIKDIAVPFTHSGKSSRNGDWTLESFPLPTDYKGCAAWNNPLKKLDFLAVKIGKIT